MSDQKPRIPVVGEYVRGIGTLIEVTDVTPPVRPITGYVFEVLNAKVELWLNGRHIDDCVTFNDLYGHERCLKSALEEAERLQDIYGPSAEFKIIKETYYICSGLLHPPSVANFYDRNFRGFREMHSGIDRSKIPESKSELYWTSTGGFVDGEQEDPA